MPTQMNSKENLVNHESVIAELEEMMKQKTVLDEIASRTKERIAVAKEEVSLETVKKQAEELGKTQDFPFEKALRQPGISFICEVKKASPSRGVITEDFPYLQIAREYESAGAAAISCLTEPYFFQGSNHYLQEISSSVSIPILRKDFTVDEYMIYEAKILGASAILLICAILSDQQLSEYLQLAQKLGMTALTEVHTKEEMTRALQAGAKVIGVNNRNLKDFSVDINTAIGLRSMAPDSVCFVAESGIRTAEDIRQLHENKTDAVLIGETLMRVKDKKGKLQELRGLIR